MLVDRTSNRRNCPSHALVLSTIPSALVAAELAAIFIAPQFVVSSGTAQSVRYTSLLESLAQRVGVVAAVGYDALRLFAADGHVRPGGRGLRRLWPPQD